jgi:hypothetical protein
MHYSKRLQQHIEMTIGILNRKAAQPVESSDVLDALVFDA